mgnify:CR=1 FL=1
MGGGQKAGTNPRSLAMLASYIPAGSLPGLGRIAGTAWSLTDLLLGGWAGGKGWRGVGRVDDACRRLGRSPAQPGPSQTCC